MPARASSSNSRPAGGGQLLALIIDADRHSWHVRGSTLKDGLRFVDVLDDLLIYVNAFLLLSGLNRLVVVAAHRRFTRVLYPPPQTLDEATKAAETAAKDDTSRGVTAPGVAERPGLSSVADALGHGIRTLGQIEEEVDDEESGGDGGALHFVINQSHFITNDHSVWPT